MGNHLFNPPYGGTDISRVKSASYSNNGIGVLLTKALLPTILTRNGHADRPEVSSSCLDGILSRVGKFKNTENIGKGRAVRSFSFNALLSLLPFLYVEWIKGRDLGHNSLEEATPGPLQVTRKPPGAWLSSRETMQSPSKAT